MRTTTTTNHHPPRGPSAHYNRADGYRHEHGVIIEHARLEVGRQAAQENRSDRNCKRVPKHGGLDRNFAAISASRSADRQECEVDVEVVYLVWWHARGTRAARYALYTRLDLPDWVMRPFSVSRRQGSRRHKAHTRAPSTVFPLKRQVGKNGLVVCFILDDRGASLVLIFLHILFACSAKVAAWIEAFAERIIPLCLELIPPANTLFSNIQTLFWEFVELIFLAKDIAEATPKQPPPIITVWNLLSMFLYNANLVETIYDCYIY